MPMPRKRPLANKEQPYTYIWRYKKEVIYVGFGKDNRGRPTCSASMGGRSIDCVKFIYRVGPENIEVEVFPTEDRDSAKALERILIAQLSPRFNTAPGVGGWRGMHTKQGLENIRAAKLGKSLSLETRRKMSEKLMGNTRLLGYKHSEQTKLKISKATKGHTVSEEHKEKLRKLHKGAGNPMYGKPSPRRGVVLSEETKQKLREAAIRRYHGNTRQKC